MSTAQAMTAVEITDRGPNWRGRVETWEARSLDGKWLYVREDDTQTLWLVADAKTRTMVHMTTSLKRARVYTASLNGKAAA